MPVVSAWVNDLGGVLVGFACDLGEVSVVLLQGLSFVCVLLSQCPSVHLMNRQIRISRGHS